MAPSEESKLQLLRSSLAAAGLENRVFFPADKQYQLSLNSYYSNQERCLTPIAIVRPFTSEEVSNLVKAILHLRAKEWPNLLFAVRSGGHTPAPGAANIDAGITIDLRGFNHIELNPSDKTVEIGPGAVWGDVYQHLSQSNLTVPGGRVANVGVGGLALGGGISYFSPRVGFVCDNIISYEIVLADGSIENVTQDSHPDLWWALKGGGSNFGIVTKFTMRAFESGNIFGGCVLHPLTTAERQIEAFCDLADPQHDFDDYGSTISVFSFRPDQGRNFFNTLSYTKPETRPVTLAGFLDIADPLFTTTRIKSQYDLASEHTKLSPESFACCFVTTTFKVDKGLLNAIRELWEQSIAHIENVPGILWTASFQPLHPAVTGKSATSGGNCLGLTGTDPLVIFLLSNFWEHTADNDAMVAKSKELIASIEIEAKRRGAYSPFKYLNYAWPGQNVFDGYGASNKARLQQIARKYDPLGFYQTAMPGGFKLF